MAKILEYIKAAIDTAIILMLYDYVETAITHDLVMIFPGIFVWIPKGKNE